MPMRSPTLTRFVVALAGLLLGGCTVYNGLQTGAAGTEPKPKIVLVSDFTFASDVVPIDRGYTAGLERKVGSYPTHERRQAGAGWRHQGKRWLRPPCRKAMRTIRPKARRSPVPNGRGPDVSGPLAAP